ncbi:MAG: 23S rRNA (adenine(2503)-C(2))-methyltransferase RlmN [Chitinophagales bacterium]
MNKKNIRSLSLEQLQQVVIELGDKPFRAKQIYHWLWQKAAHSFDEMLNIPKKLIEQLREQYAILPVQIAKKQVSNDGTVKFGFQLFDSHIVEGVLIPSPDLTRMTACVSSQVGCSLACSFCATGLLDRKRNLTADEIFDQVVFIKQEAEKRYNQPLTNIVYMGMGEPLLNYKEVVRSTERITAPDGLNMSAKRITVSTAGISKMIRKLADDDTKFNLAVSLHAANDTKRNEIMAINETNSLEVLADALRYYYEKLGRQVTYEYIAFNSFNDSIEDAEELVKFCKIIPSKVNIIEYNTVAGLDFFKTTEDRLEKFQKYVESQGITATLRRSRGKDIDAACGQLANK